jgi:hypothetical protein
MSSSLQGQGGFFWANSLFAKYANLLRVNLKKPKPSIDGDDFTNADTLTPLPAEIG